MKNRRILLVFALLLSLTAFAQTPNNQTESKEETEFRFRRNIQLENCKKNEEVIISIAENTKQFKLQIDSSVSSGKVTVEIYDPKGKRQGTFSVGTQLKIENAELANGTINKKLLEPEEGDWTVKIIPLSAKGTIIINTLSWL